MNNTACTTEVVQCLCATFCSSAHVFLFPSLQQLTSLSVPTQSTLVVLSQAASNYGLKLVQLTGELISHCYQALTFAKWTQRDCKNEKRG